LVVLRQAVILPKQPNPSYNSSATENDMSDPTRAISIPMTLAEAMARQQKTEKTRQQVGQDFKAPPVPGSKTKSNLTAMVLATNSRINIVVDLHGKPMILVPGLLSKKYDELNRLPKHAFTQNSSTTVSAQPTRFYAFVVDNYVNTEFHHALMRANHEYAFGGGTTLAQAVRVATKLGPKYPVTGLDKMMKLWKASRDLGEPITPLTWDAFVNTAVWKNSGASDGLPYSASHAEVGLLSFKIASDIRKTIVKDLDDKSLKNGIAEKASRYQKLMANNAELFVVKMNNKQGAYERSVYDGKLTIVSGKPVFDKKLKTRSIFVFPGWMHFFVQPLNDAIYQALPKWHDGSDSPIALGMSWTHGGAEKFVSRIFALRDGETCAFTYGDDNLYVTRHGDEFEAYSPDIEAMDLSQTKKVGVALLQYALRKAKAPREVIHFWMKYYIPFLYTAPVLFGSHLFSIKDGLRSGAYPTSIVSTLITAMVADTFISGTSRDKTPARERVPLLLASVGLKVKETDNVHRFRRDATELPFTFLGVGLFKRELGKYSGWIAGRRRDDVFRSLAAPNIKPAHKSDIGIEAGRIAQLMFYSLHDPEVVGVLSDYLRHLNATAATIPEVDMFAEFPLRMPPVPSVEYLARLHFESVEEFIPATVEADKQETPAGTDSAAAFGAAFSNWADEESEVDYQERIAVRTELPAIEQERAGGLGTGAYAEGKVIGAVSQSKIVSKKRAEKKRKDPRTRANPTGDEKMQLIEEIARMTMAQPAKGKGKAAQQAVAKSAWDSSSDDEPAHAGSSSSDTESEFYDATSGI